MNDYETKHIYIANKGWDTDITVSKVLVKFNQKTLKFINEEILVGDKPYKFIEMPKCNLNRFNKTKKYAVSTTYEKCIELYIKTLKIEEQDLNDEFAYRLNENKKLQKNFRKAMKMEIYKI